MRDVQTHPRSGGKARAEAGVAQHASFDAQMQAYLRDGEARALALPNRGPIRFDGTGRLAQDIVDTYYEYGFYVFKNVLSTEELADIEVDVLDILDRLPVEQGSPVDAKGRPALAANCEAPTLFWAKPLSDPFGGTEQAAGRHPVKMGEPKPAKDAPKEIVYLILGSLQFSQACLRGYAHPQLLQVAATINGDDFVPFNEAIFIKKPGEGASVAWHQDGVTHWDSPNWDPNCHGFNFMAQLYGCTAANGVWIVPGSHKLGRIDIGAKAAQAGSDRLPDAVPMICDPGDVVISNRQCLHGSFANTSPDWRVTINFGFNRRASVFGVTSGGLHNARAHYDEERIRKRSRLISYAISARRQRFPDETPFIYKPHTDAGEQFEWEPKMMAQLKDYNLLDMGI